MPKRYHLAQTLTLFLLFAVTSCNAGKSIETSTRPDYSNDKYWSIKDDAKHDIDVFFVHPTTYGPPSNGKLIADLEDTELNEITDRNTVDWITAAFSERCNVFCSKIPSGQHRSYENG